MDEDEEVDEADSHSVDAFDRGTRIMIMTDGSMRVKFPLMPPSWPCVDGAFDSFEDRLSQALGVEVEGLDKEFFGIPKPAADTVERLRAYLIDLRARYEVK